MRRISQELYKHITYYITGQPYDVQPGLCVIINNFMEFTHKLRLPAQDEQGLLELFDVKIHSQITGSITSSIHGYRQLYVNTHNFQRISRGVYSGHCSYCYRRNCGSWCINCRHTDDEHQASPRAAQRGLRQSEHDIYIYTH